MLIDAIEQKTIIIFKTFEIFVTYITAKHVDYDSEDVIFTGWFYKLNTLENKKVNRSQYGRGTDFERDIVENIGDSCYNPTSGDKMY